jgi:hypothetical protein
VKTTTYINQTPFLDITPPVRIAILFFFFAYRIVFPVAAALVSDGSKDLLAARILAETVFTLLLAYPFIFHRPAYGWLHPLVLPTLFTLGKSLVKNPLHIFFPFEFPMVDFTVETSSPAAVLSIGAHDLAQARLGEALVRCASMAVLLAAFLFGPRFRVPRIRVYKPSRLVPAAIASIGALTLISVAFVVSQGGLTQLLIAMRGGRRELFAESGHFLFAADVASMIALIWFMYEKRPFRNPLFLAGFAGSCLLGILVTGSRSSLIVPVVMLVLLWWKRSGRPLIVPTVSTALVGILVLGIFGSIRQDFGSTTLDVSVLNPSRYGEMVQRALEETQKRGDEEPTIAVFQGATEKGLLWGRTYVGTLAFWIPRAVWPDKPKPADAYNMWVNFANNPIDSEIPNYGYWGIPVSPHMEAFWNFHLAGTILIFFLLGTIYRYMADAVPIYAQVPIFWALYVFTLMQFDGGSRTTVDVLRTLLVIIIFGYLAGIFRSGQPAGSRPAINAYRNQST